MHAAEEDYNAQNISVIFGPDEFERFVRVPIINDPFRENRRLSMET